jgi:hypothetical protein
MARGRGRRQRGHAEVSPIGALLARWLSQKQLTAELRPYQIVGRWRELVGERIAARTRPRGRKDGVLTVAVASASWLNELSFLRTDLVARINEILGEGWVRSVRLVAGPVQPLRETRPVARRPPPVPVPPELLGEVEREVALVEDAELRHAIRGAWCAGLERRARKGSDAEQ